eukprot:CAMPEP_0170158812 /NCGR_PEP_ID=MMETSP0033_2-20121228/69156_1 /TAXON_ID=195969 /ORGANISM="Dolichomastix tenuilepis, Strain CCMP3274" /LENGTH=363 /DNA_ID=CAMNT_0010396267 /DNA_START=150 /DNA_END=1241 /DNA_ORIENTATION=-
MIMPEILGFWDKSVHGPLFCKNSSGSLQLNSSLRSLEERGLITVVKKEEEFVGEVLSVELTQGLRVWPVTFSTDPQYQDYLCSEEPQSIDTVVSLKKYDHAKLCNLLSPTFCQPIMLFLDHSEEHVTTTGFILGHNTKREKKISGTIMIVRYSQLDVEQLVKSILDKAILSKDDNPVIKLSFKSMMLGTKCPEVPWKMQACVSDIISCPIVRDFVCVPVQRTSIEINWGYIHIGNMKHNESNCCGCMAIIEIDAGSIATLPGASTNPADCVSPVANSPSKVTQVPPAPILHAPEACVMQPSIVENSSLDDFLAGARLEHLADALKGYGVECIDDLKALNEVDMKALGFKVLETRRLADALRTK